MNLLAWMTVGGIALGMLAILVLFYRAVKNPFGGKHATVGEMTEVEMAAINTEELMDHSHG